MVLSDFLSRIEGDESSPHEVIPMLFNIHSIMSNQYYTIANDIVESYRVQTRSAMKTTGVQMPKVYGAEEEVHPNLNTKYW